ncbi:hypothetical protein HW537_09295 [Asaia siamensis]
MMMRSSSFSHDRFLKQKTDRRKHAGGNCWPFLLGATALVLAGLLLSSVPVEAQDLACVSMLKKEERLIHRISQRRHEPRLPPNAPGYPGLAVRFDPLPGFGIMQGALWTPEGGIESDSEVKETLDSLEKQRVTLHDAETSAHCAPAQ